MITYNVLYFVSLGTCPHDYDDPNICIAFFRSMYPVWLGETISCAALWFSVMIMSFYGLADKKWMLICIINYICLFFYQSGTVWEDHGGLNRMIMTIAVTILFLIYSIGNFFRKVYQYSLKVFTMVLIVITIGATIFYIKSIKYSCENWEKGLGGKQIINDENLCHIPIPTYCELGTRDNWIDFTKLTYECDLTRTYLNKEMLHPDLQDRENLTVVGFPRTERFPDHIRADKYLYRPYIRERIIDMNDESIPKEVKDNIEFTVDISDPEHHKLNIELKPNITKAEEQRKLREKIIKKEKAEGTYDSRIDKNVLILYIDNISRAHFYRKMPKTAEWLSQFVDNPQSKFTTYQYFRYHSVYFNTIFNNNALYYGEIEHVNDTSQNLFDSYSKNGYITGHFKDSCDTISNSINDPNMKLHEWDHLGGGICCDTNYDDQDFRSLTVFVGKASAVRRCLYGRNMHEIQMDYLKQFWAAYPNNRKFFRTHLSEAHELVGELVKYMDEDMRDLLQHFYDMGYLEDTFLTLVADHGAHALTLRFPAFPDNSRYIENYYPILFHVTKNDIPETNRKFLASNEQSFISSHDIYSTFKTIAENKRSTSKYVESYPYIMEQVPETHDCSNSTVFLAHCWCRHDIDHLHERIDAKGLFYAKV